MTNKEQLKKINKGLNNLSYTEDQNWKLIEGFKHRFILPLISDDTFEFKRITTKDLESLKSELRQHLVAAKITEEQWKEAMV